MEYAEELLSQQYGERRYLKIMEYIALLEERGLSLGHPYIRSIKHEQNLWELRPSSDRLFFFAWIDGAFVILHGF